MIYVDLLIIICYFPQQGIHYLGCRGDLWGYNGGLTDVIIKTLGNSWDSMEKWGKKCNQEDDD